MMFGVGGFVFFTIIISQVFSRDIDYCFAHYDQSCSETDTETRMHDFINGGKTRLQKIPNCQPVQIWMLIQDGIRYPTISEIKQMMKLGKLQSEIIDNHISHRRGRLNETDIENLRQWHLDTNMKVETAEQLTEQGILDLRMLAWSIKKDFPELFPRNLQEIDPKYFEFHSRNGNQTKTSLRAFTSGLFGRPDVPADDMLMTHNCSNNQNEHTLIYEPFLEVAKFENSTEYQNLIVNVSQRLGLTQNITNDEVNIIHKICLYDKTRNVNAVSPWCEIFNKEELQILEFRDDLEKYYKHAHNSKSKLQLGCGPIQDLLRNFKKLENGDYSSSLKGIFNIENIDTLNFFMVAMGFVSDSTPHLATNYHMIRKNRERLLDIGLLANNVAAVFYKCNGTESPNKVKFYTLEKQQNSYDGCDISLCNWKYLRTKFENAVSNCDSETCYLNSAISSCITPTAIIWYTVIVLIFWSDL